MSLASLKFSRQDAILTISPAPTSTQDANLRAGHFVFLNLANGSQRNLQWHPVTIADVDRSPPTHTTVRVHMKQYGAWTRVGNGYKCRGVTLLCYS